MSNFLRLTPPRNGARLRLRRLTPFERLFADLEISDVNALYQDARADKEAKKAARQLKRKTKKSLQAERKAAKDAAKIEKQRRKHLDALLPKYEELASTTPQIDWDPTGGVTPTPSYPTSNVMPYAPTYPETWFPELPYIGPAQAPQVTPTSQTFLDAGYGTPAATAAPQATAWYQVPQADSSGDSLLDWLFNLFFGDLRTTDDLDYESFALAPLLGSLGGVIGSSLPFVDKILGRSSAKKQQKAMDKAAAKLQKRVEAEAARQREHELALAERQATLLREQTASQSSMMIKLIIGAVSAVGVLVVGLLIISVTGRQSHAGASR